MSPSTLQSIFKSSISATAIAGIVLLGSLMPQQAQANSINSAYTKSGTLGGSYTKNPSSFGFYFDVEGQVSINGLGFAAQSDWTTNNYEVKLWSYTNGGLLFPDDYSELASVTFNPNTSYTLKDDYLWQELTGGNVLLPDTYTTDFSDSLGYVITAIGDFSDSDPSPTANTNVVYETGVAIFDPRILYDTDPLVGSAGFNFTDTGNTNYPVPFFRPGRPDNTIGYFNANFSIAPVPGPLPLLGAATGFAWTRRLRKRISVSK
jgi:hypothetical protein